MAIDGTDLRATRRDLENALAGALARGADDAAALRLSARLGAITAEIGNRHEARRHFRRVADAGPAALGANHPLVRQAEAYLSGDLTVDGRASDDRAIGSPAADNSATSGRARAAAPVQAPGRDLVRAGMPRGDLVRIPAADRDDELAGQDHRPPRPPRRRGRRGGAKSLTVSVVASLAVITLTVAGVALWRRALAPAAATTEAAKPIAPQQVTVTAKKGAVTVRWQDPAHGRAPFIVTGGLAGQKTDIRQQVDAGQTSVVINGLNASRDYCFAVVAVYSADQIAVSALACTDH